MIGSADQPPEGSRRRDLRELGADDLSDIQTMDVDMTAHVMMERAAFPAGAAYGPAAPAEPITADSAPAARVGLAAGLLLALRFVQARFLSVWGLLVAAALCPAQAFADFAVFSAFVSFVSIAALLRLEAIFFQNSSHERLGRAFRLALATGTGFLGLAALGVVAAVAAGQVAPAIGALFLVSLAGRAILRLVSAEAMAEGDFRAIGNSNVLQALVQPAMMLLLIWTLGATSLSLFAADAIGHAVTAGYMLWRRRSALTALVAPALWSLHELVTSTHRWRAAPRLLLPSALLSYGFTVVPLMALPYGSNPLLAAHVALSMRLLEVPTQMFAAVSVPLVLNSLRTQSGAGRQGWVRVLTLWLLAGAAALFAAIAVVAMTADALLDATQWAGIGEIVAIMALFYGGIALVTPLHEITSLSRHPRRQVATNAVALLAAVLAMLWFETLSLPLLCVIGLVSLARMLALIQFAWTRLGTDAVPARSA